LKDTNVKTLQVIETAYRATVEEQDDTIVWLTHAMAGAGGQFGLLLAGNAVCYAARGQPAPALELGDWGQSHARDLSADVAALAAKGIPLYAVEEDLEERGLLDATLVGSLQVIARANLPRLFDEYPRVWKW
jgi:sulfur relay (sulfurtransferase) DsrF/TusC family protein